MVYISICRAMRILGFLAVITTSVSAAFSAEDLQRYDGLTVISRQSEAHSFEISDELTAKIKDEFRSGLRSWSTDPVSKQVQPNPRRLRHALQDYPNGSEITLEACTVSTCTGCTTYKETFKTAFCQSTAGTNCIIINLLGDAHISYWNHDSCSGRVTSFYGCGSTNRLATPGTNSIGFAIGCS